jgi:anaerobic C4-dicarboxylate transporter DcuA/anaerobic C4-dicarboxylate transporter DcuB
MKRIESKELPMPSIWLKENSNLNKANLKQNAGTNEGNNAGNNVGNSEISEVEKLETSLKKGAKSSAILFLLGVLAIVIMGLFPTLIPHFYSETTNTYVPLSTTTMIQLIMFTVAGVILFVSKPKISEVPNQSVFKSGITAVIVVFGLIWLVDTFITAHKSLIVGSLGGLIQTSPWVFFVAIFVLCVLTTSQTLATQSTVPLAITAGLAPGLLVGMWTAGYGGIFILPTNAQQIVAVNLDYTNSTKLGTKLVDHSFFFPSLVLTVSCLAFGSLMGVVLGAV